MAPGLPLARLLSLVLTLVTFLALPAAGGPGAVAAPPAAPPSCAPGVGLLGFSDALDKQTFAGLGVGGLSALAYDRRREVYYALVDNERETPARFYTLRLPLTGAGLGAPAIAAVTTLRDAAGRPFTGADFDGEGLAVTGRGELLSASETEPALRRFALDGALLEELPVPARFLIAPAGEARANLTFESLALSPGERSLFTATEGPLGADGRTTDGRGRLRLLRLDDRGRGGFRPAAQFFYLTEPGQGLVELAALSERELLVLERGFFPGLGGTARVFRVSLHGANDLSDRASLADPDLAPLRKELVVDLAACPPGGARSPAPQANPLLDNVEGMALGPRLPDGRRALLLLSDDNFGRAQVTRLVALSVRLPGQAPEAMRRP
jgi:hypothetical protein